MDVHVQSAVPPARAWRVRVGAGWLACALSLGLVALGLGLTIADGRSVLDDEVALGCVVGVGNAGIGGFVLTRHPGSRIGWLFAFQALTRAVAVAATGWSERALATSPGSLPGGALASWLQAWAVLPGIATLPLLVVLFPDGRLPGRRWRVVPMLSAVALVLVGVLVPAGLWSYRGRPLLPDSPTPSGAAARAVLVLMASGLVLAVIAILLGLAALVGRARRSAGELRQQVKWFAYGAGFGLAFNFAGALPGLGWIRLVGAASVLTGIGLGIFRYRLYDIDRLINRTLVYGTVSIALAGAFAALDVTLAAVVGRDSVLIAAGSAFAVALLLRPARDRAQNLVDRVFDRRAHDAVAMLQRLGQRVGQQPVEPRTVEAALRRALRDPGLLLYYYAGESDELIDGDGRRIDCPPASAASAPAGNVADPVIRDGERIALLVHAPIEPALLRAVVQAASAVLEHARLQAELLVQLAEVRASRARLVSAADLERRRIERDLHDGAQQRLVGLALHVQSAKRRTEHPPEVADLLGFTVEQLHAGLEDIRSLVHGILPPALAASGLPAALAELARRDAVVVSCDVPARLDPDVEVTAWFVACEGVANAAKHAPGHRVRVEVSARPGALLVEVSDDGPGGASLGGDGLRNLADRVDARGGSMSVDSPRGGGTRLRAELPCAS